MGYNPELTAWEMPCLTTHVWNLPPIMEFTVGIGPAQTKTPTGRRAQKCGVGYTNFATFWPMESPAMR
jgi:hypothetical protein